MLVKYQNVIIDANYGISLKLWGTSTRFALAMLTSTVYTGVFIAAGMSRHRQKPPSKMMRAHDDVYKWKNFLRYWPFVWGIYRSPVNAPHKGQWRGALMFSLICAWTNGWVNNQDAGVLRHYSAHYDVTVMLQCFRRSWTVNDSMLPKCPF